MTVPLLLHAILEARLTPAQREAFIDTEYLGRTCDEVAETMGCSRQAVSQIVGRARDKLAATEVVAELRTAA